MVSLPLVQIKVRLQILSLAVVPSISGQLLSHSRLDGLHTLPVPETNSIIDSSCYGTRRPENRRFGGFYPRKSQAVGYFRFIDMCHASGVSFKIKLIPIEWQI